MSRTGLAQSGRPIKRSELWSHVAGPATTGSAAGVGFPGSSGLSPEGPILPESFGGGCYCHLHFGDETLRQREAMGTCPQHGLSTFLAEVGFEPRHSGRAALLFSKS